MGKKNSPSRGSEKEDVASSDAIGLVWFWFGGSNQTNQVDLKLKPMDIHGKPVLYTKYRSLV